MRRPALLLLAVLFLVAGGSGRAAAAVRPAPWATVNVCDTERHPDVLGLRASIPGTGRRAERMAMRFRVQWYSRRARAWRFVAGAAGDSGWVSVGSARYRRRETGVLFRFKPPSGQDAFVLRGVVDFRWTQRGRRARGARRITAGGHRSSAGADPRAYSAASCEII